MDGERAGAAGTREGAPGDVVCLGESMALFVPSGDGRGNEWRQIVGGAESNVACHLAGAGLTSRWVSALGADPFGRAVLDALSGAGVRTADVRIDPDRPTGVYFKASTSGRSEVTYYRSGSAAAALGPDLLDDLDLSGTALVHLSGITPALSGSCRALPEAVLSRRPPNALVSFDVNWRPVLWRAPGAADVDDPGALLRDLADRADIVFVGSDEAEAIWRRSSVAEIRELLPRPRSLVIKHGGRGATLVEGGEETFEPALNVDVVEPVGAGDAFAAGFLSATLRGRGRQERLRTGHLQAAAVLCGPEDVGPPLEPSAVSRMLAADHRTWAAAVIREGQVIG